MMAVVAMIPECKAIIALAGLSLSREYTNIFIAKQYNTLRNISSLQDPDLT
jgi:hypothetical protein